MLHELDVQSRNSSTVYKDSSLGKYDLQGELMRGHYPIFRRSNGHLGKKSARFDENFERIEADVEERCGDSQKVRRKRSMSSQLAPFTKYTIPDLVLITIFEDLNKRDLCSVMRTCRRFYTVGEIVNNWNTVDMADKRISEYTLAALRRRRVIALRLSDSKGDMTCQLPDHIFNDNIASRIRVLDISRASMNYRHLLLLLRTCFELKCLSLEGHKLNDEISECIAQNSDLRRLDLSMTSGLSDKGIYNITSKCRYLEELNLSWCELTNERCLILCRYLTSILRKINLSGTIRNNGLNDNIIFELVHSCPMLVDVDISDNMEVTSVSLKFITSMLQNITTLSCNRCYGIDPNSFVALNGTKIKYLNVHGCIVESNVELFRTACDKLEVNRQIFNFTAKPSASMGHSSKIWGVPLCP